MLAVSVGAGALNGFVVFLYAGNPAVDDLCYVHCFRGAGAVGPRVSPIYVNTTALNDFLQQRASGHPHDPSVYRNTVCDLASVQEYALGNQALCCGCE